MAKKKLTLEDMLVPKEEIPYEVPENWCWTYFGYLCKLNNGYAFKSTQYKESGIPILRISNINSFGIDFENAVYSDEKEELEKFVVNKGDLLIAMSGATTGKTGVYDLNKKSYLNQRVGNLKIVNDSAISEKYRNYFILHKSEEILNLAYGGAQPNISGKMIDSMKIPLPPLAEQERIVNRIESLFDKVDKAAGLVDEAREGFEKRKTAILEKGFKGEVIGKEYTELVNLGELITDVSSGFACGKQNEISKDEDGAYPHFRPNNVGFYNQFNYDKIVYIPQEKVQKGKGTLSKGDIIFNNTNSTELVGRAVVVRDDMDTAFSNHLTRIRVDESRVIPEWVAYCINTLWKQGYFARICKQWVGQSGVNQDVLKNEVAIPVPPIDEQRNIVDILDKLLEKEFEIEDCSNIDRSIDVIKKSILAKAFRGELGSNDLDEESIKSLLD